MVFHLVPIVMRVMFIPCNSLYERRKVWGRQALLNLTTSRGALEKVWPLFVISRGASERVSKRIREAI